jgi:hypothetical protein
VLWTAGILAGSALLGIAPPLRALWVVTGITAVALAGYVGLVAYAQANDADSVRQPASRSRHSRHSRTPLFDHSKAVRPHRLGGYSYAHAASLRAETAAGAGDWGAVNDGELFAPAGGAGVAVDVGTRSDEGAPASWTAYPPGDDRGDEVAWEYEDQRRAAVSR